jgi:hypothetical protein
VQRALAAAATVVGLLSIASPAFACGACDEDKMAATYDYEVVQRAAAQRRAVVFCGLEGAFDERAARRAAAALPGVDPRSVRASREPAALSFALDTSALAPEAAAQRIQRALRGTARVSVIKTMGPPGAAAAAPH